MIRRHRLSSTADRLIRELVDLQCDYTGATRGRNRLRALNHVPFVRGRLALVKLVECNGILKKALSAYISKSKSATHVLSKIEKAFDGSEVKAQYGSFAKCLSHFIQRNHIEFHPTDHCQLTCFGCTYKHDILCDIPTKSFPGDKLNNITEVFKPEAITIVGGGEPSLYRSGNFRLGDLIYEFADTDKRTGPKIGLITNGIFRLHGGLQWHKHIDWIRVSLDSGSAVTYRKLKGIDKWNLVVLNIEKLLKETLISEIGVGFVYHSENMNDVVSMIKYFSKMANEGVHSEKARLNIQFRPWRSPVGRPRITEPVISEAEAMQTAINLLEAVHKDDSLKEFVRNNTNIAQNLLCCGAREVVAPFCYCMYGMSKLVVRADGQIYPCFRTAASESSEFCMGNILIHSNEEIALRSLYVLTITVPKLCLSDYERCLLCTFNNLLEDGVFGKVTADSSLSSQWFF